MRITFSLLNFLILTVAAWLIPTGMSQFFSNPIHLRLFSLVSLLFIVTAFPVFSAERIDKDENS